jgi:hypothetical protein
MDNPPKDTIDKTRQKTGMACWGVAHVFETTLVSKVLEHKK